MALVTKAEFARLHEVSKPAVQKWESQGYLVLEGGKVDVEASDAKLRGARMGRFREAKEAVNQPTRVNRSVNRQPVTPSAAEDAAATIETFLRKLLDGEYETAAEADRVKANVLAGLRALEFQQKAGALVEMATAEAVLFGEFRAARDAWLNWPARVGPLVAADLGVEADKVTEVLTAHVHQHLAELGEPEADFGGEG